MTTRLMAGVVIAAGAVMTAAPGRASAPQQTNPNAERCAQIMQMLVGNGPGEGLGQMRRGDRSWTYSGGQYDQTVARITAAERALASNRNAGDEARLRKAVDDEKAELNRIAGLINRFSEQLTELKCPDAPRADGQITGGGGGGGVEATPTPIPTATPTAPPGPGRGGRGAAAPIDPATWRGDWNTDMGILRLAFNQDRGGTQDLVSGKNGWGPPSNCPENATMYGGEITWKANTNWGLQEFEAPVVACAVGGVLEGKFNNTAKLTAAEAGQGRIRVGYFKFTMSIVDGRQSFAGTVYRWNHVGQMPLDGFSTFFSGRR